MRAECVEVVAAAGAGAAAPCCETAAFAVSSLEASKMERGESWAVEAFEELSVKVVQVDIRLTLC